MEHAQSEAVFLLEEATVKLTMDVIERVVL